MSGVGNKQSTLALDSGDRKQAQVRVCTMEKIRVVNEVSENHGQ